MTETTTNMGLKLVDFDTTPWHEDVNNNFRVIDSVVKTLTGVSGVSGVWTNATTVTVGQKWADPLNFNLWLCLVDHTTASTGSFESDRAANPTYWESVGTGVNARGAWTADTQYNVGDLAYDAADILYCICEVNHVSTTSLRDDLGNWTVMLDGNAVPSTTDVSYGTAQTLTTNQRNQAKDNIYAKAPKITLLDLARFLSNPTFTFDVNCRYYEIEAVGGGGGGGGVEGDLGEYGVAAGGNSGTYGKTLRLTKGAYTTATFVVGTGGVGGVGAADGVHGGDTSWTDTDHSFIWPGGRRGNSISSSADGAIGSVTQNPAATGSMVGGWTCGMVGSIRVTGSGGVRGGMGGSNPLGAAANDQLISTNISEDGKAAVGYGAGGGGSGTNNSPADGTGGNGFPGVIIVTEYF